MIEVRAFSSNLDNAKAILAQEDATLKGEYTIHDTIYRNIDSTIPLDEEFLRLREIPKNIWDEKEVILALKQTKLRKIGKNSHVPIKLQYDKREDAERYYEENLQDAYVEDFNFWRVGWQYLLKDGNVVDLEIIEKKYPSIELKSATDAGIEKLVGRFAIRKEDIITGPSVVTIKQLILSESDS